MHLCSLGPRPRGWVFPIRHRIPRPGSFVFSYILLKFCFFDSLHVFNKYIFTIAFIIAGLVDIMTYCSGVFWAHLSTESLFDTKGKNLLTLPSKNIQRRLVSSGATVVFFKTIFSVNLGLDPDPNYSTTVFYE